MPKMICAIVLFCMIFASGAAFPIPGSAESKTSKIMLSGKLFCSLKRQVVMQFKGIVTSLHVHSGQQVKEGEILARYRLDPETVYTLRQDVLEFRIKDLEMNLAQVEKTLAGLSDEIRKRVPLESEIQLAEVDKGLLELEEKRKEIKGLAENNMAPAHSLKKVEREIELMKKKRVLIRRGQPLERKRITREMELLKKKGVEDLLVLTGGIIPDEDIQALEGAGVSRVFPPGTDTGEIIDYIKSNARPRH